MHSKYFSYLDTQNQSDSNTNSLPETNSGWSDSLIILIVVVAVVIAKTGFICLMNRFLVIIYEHNRSKSQFTLCYFIL